MYPGWLLYNLTTKMTMCRNRASLVTYLVEWLNHTLLQMLCTLQVKQKTKWKEKLPHIMHEAKDFSPFFFYGRTPWPLIDMLFGSKKAQNHQATQQWANRMRDTHKIDADISQNSSDKGKKQKDRRVRGVSRQLGDRVLVKRLWERESRETASY